MEENIKIIFSFARQSLANACLAADNATDKAPHLAWAASNDAQGEMN